MAEKKFTVQPLETKHFIVQPLETKYFCDKDTCTGEVVQASDKTTRFCIPPQFLHICDKCSEEYFLNKIYPRIEYIIEKKLKDI